MPHRIRLVAVSVCVLGAGVALGPTQSTAAPIAHASRSCNVPAYPGSGYFTSLSVKHVSCRFGRRLALAYYRCRTRSGPAGRCHRRRVLRYRCTEVRQSIAVEIDGRVTCKRGHMRVVHTYQQNL